MIKYKLKLLIHSQTMNSFTAKIVFFIEKAQFEFFFVSEIWEVRSASQITKIFSIHSIQMIIVPARFHSCDAEILKMHFKRHKINSMSLKNSALFPEPFIFLKLEYASYILKNVSLKYKSRMKSTQTQNPWNKKPIFRRKKNQMFLSY